MAFTQSPTSSNNPKILYNYLIFTLFISSLTWAVASRSVVEREVFPTAQALHVLSICCPFFLPALHPFFSWALSASQSELHCSNSEWSNSRAASGVSKKWQVGRKCSLGDPNNTSSQTEMPKHKKQPSCRPVWQAHLLRCWIKSVHIIPVDFHQISGKLFAGVCNIEVKILVPTKQKSCLGTLIALLLVKH